jgi:hypothetical protein
MFSGRMTYISDTIRNKAGTWLFIGKVDRSQTIISRGDITHRIKYSA